MNVNFYATLREVTGKKTVAFEVPENTTVRQLLAMVVERYPPLSKILLQENGDLWGHVHVFINGRDAPFLSEQMDTVIQPADTISIFPAVGGG